MSEPSLLLLPLSHFALPADRPASPFCPVLQDPTPPTERPRSDPGAPAGGNSTGGTGTGGNPDVKVPTSSPPQGDCMSQLTSMMPMLLVFFGLMYFMVIRPQQKKQREMVAMLGALKKGDRVVTSAGMHGEVFAIDDRTVTLLVDTLKITFDKNAILRVDRGDAARS
jgi:preprotein translocase subunit YajC